MGGNGIAFYATPRMSRNQIGSDGSLSQESTDSLPAGLRWVGQRQSKSETKLDFPRRLENMKAQKKHKLANRQAKECTPESTTKNHKLGNTFTKNSTAKSTKKHKLPNTISTTKNRKNILKKPQAGKHKHTHKKKHKEQHRTKPQTRKHSHKK